MRAACYGLGLVLSVSSRRQEMLSPGAALEVTQMVCDRCYGTTTLTPSPDALIVNVPLAVSMA